MDKVENTGHEEGPLDPLMHQINEYLDAGDTFERREAWLEGIMPTRRQFVPRQPRETLPYDFSEQRIDIGAITADVIAKVGQTAAWFASLPLPRLRIPSEQAYLMVDRRKSVDDGLDQEITVQRTPKQPNDSIITFGYSGVNTPTPVNHISISNAWGLQITAAREKGEGSTWDIVQSRTPQTSPVLIVSRIATDSTLNAMIKPTDLELQKVYFSNELRAMAQGAYNAFQGARIAQGQWPRNVPSVYEETARIDYTHVDKGDSRVDVLAITTQPSSPIARSDSQEQPATTLSVARHSDVLFELLFKRPTGDGLRYTHLFLGGSRKPYGYFQLEQVSQVAHGDLEVYPNLVTLSTINHMLGDIERALPSLSQTQRSLRRIAHRYLKRHDPPLWSKSLPYDNENGHQIDFPMS